MLSAWRVNILTLHVAKKKKEYLTNFQPIHFCSINQSRYVKFLYIPQNFEPVPYPKNNYGKFFTGDSFIILNVSLIKWYMYINP